MAFFAVANWPCGHTCAIPPRANSLAADTALPFFRARYFRAQTEPTEGIEPSFQVYKTSGLPLTYVGMAGRRGVEPRCADLEYTLVTGPQPISVA